MEAENKPIRRLLVNILKLPLMIAASSMGLAAIGLGGFKAAFADQTLGFDDAGIVMAGAAAYRVSCQGMAQAIHNILKALPKAKATEQNPFTAQPT